MSHGKLLARMERQPIVMWVHRNLPKLEKRRVSEVSKDEPRQDSGEDGTPADRHVGAMKAPKARKTSRAEALKQDPRQGAVKEVKDGTVGSTGCEAMVQPSLFEGILDLVRQRQSLEGCPSRRTTSVLCF